MTFDRILLTVVRRRLAQHRSRGDSADKLGDKLIQVLSAEIARRQAEIDRIERRRRNIFKVC